MVFDIGQVLDYSFQPEHIAVFFTLILLEGVLSFDNAAVLAAMVRKLPEHQRQKALLYGIGGAYVFRVLAIIFVFVIIQNPWLKLVGGLYLLYLAIKHLHPRFAEDDEDAPTIFQRLGISSFWGVVISVELADIAFALDQILAAVALTDEVLIIIVAAMFAILFIRIAAGYMTRLMAWFPALEKLAYLAVGFVGLKLVAEEVAHYLGFTHFEISKTLSVAVTLSLLVVPVILKYLHERFISPGAAT